MINPKRILTNTRTIPSNSTSDTPKVYYKCSWVIPCISRKIRKILNTPKNYEESTYTTHCRSNLTRIEFEINRNPNLKALFTEADLALQSYKVLTYGFTLLFNTNLKVICIYHENNNRDYKIIKNDTCVYQAMLDSPIPTNSDTDNSY